MFCYSIYQILLNRPFSHIRWLIWSEDTHDKIDKIRFDMIDKILLHFDQHPNWWTNLGINWCFKIEGNTINEFAKYYKYAWKKLRYNFHFKHQHHQQQQQQQQQQQKHLYNPQWSQKGSSTRLSIQNAAKQRSEPESTLSIKK